MLRAVPIEKAPRLLWRQPADKLQYPLHGRLRRQRRRRAAHIGVHPTRMHHHRQNTELHHIESQNTRQHIQRSFARTITVIAVSALVR